MIDLAGRDLNDADSRDRLFIAAIIMTGILRDYDPRRSLAVCDHTLSRLAEVSHGETARHQEVRMLAESSYALRSLGRNQEARERLNRAVERLRQLKLYPVRQPVPESSDTLSALAEYDAATGNVPRAVETYENLLQLSLAGGDKPDTVLLDAAEVSRLYTKLAGLHGRLGHADFAAGAAAGSVCPELWSRWDSRLAQNSFIHRQLSAATAPVPAELISIVTSRRHAMAITQFLKRLETGDEDAMHVVIPMVYEELKKLARAHLRREGAAVPLETTSLVHEARRRAEGRHPSYENRAHFYGIASRVMRQVLVDTARARATDKRNAAQEVPFADVIDWAPEPNRAVLAMDDALQQLWKNGPNDGAELIDMRFFGGMTAGGILGRVVHPGAQSAP